MLDKNNSLLIKSKELFSQFENRLNILEGYLELVHGQIENWLEWQDQDRQKMIKQKADLYLVKYQKEYPNAQPTQLKELAEGKAYTEFLEQGIHDFKTSGKIGIFLEEETYSLEKELLPRFIKQSIISLASVILEALLKELVFLLESQFGHRYLSKKDENNNKIPTYNYLIQKANLYGFLKDLNKKTFMEINHIREVRNNFVHSLEENTEIGEIGQALLAAGISKKSKSDHQSATDLIMEIKSVFVDFKRSFLEGSLKS